MAVDWQSQTVGGFQANSELEVLRRFFDHSVAASAILDKDFNFIRVNPVYAAADERHPDEFPGRNHFDLYPSDEIHAIFQQVVDSGQPYQAFARPFVYAHNPERGVTYWDWTLVPVLNTEKQVELLLFSLNDVTKRKRAEIELERFFELSLDLFAIISMRSGKFVRLNKACESMLGYKQEYLATRPFLEWVSPADRAVAIKHIAHLRRGKPLNSATLRHAHIDGTCRWLRWNCVPVVEEGIVYAVARDVTEEKRLQDERIRLERLKLVGQMAASIGHEVRNPVTAVRGYLQLLWLKPEFEAQKEQLGIVLQELDRTHEIITRFLSLAQDRPIEQHSENLPDIVKGMLPLINASANEAGMNVKLELQPVAPVLADRSEISQLLLNLVRNGFEAMSAGGSLIIQTYMDAEMVVLAVQDQGSGISPEVLSKLGTPFYTTKENGTGLGMAICNSIMNRHSGHLQIASGSTGTTIRACFPQLKG